MLIHWLILFLASLAGVQVGCNLYDYQISNTRKLGAPMVFSVLALVPIPLPIPFLDIILPLVAMYMLLVDDSYERSKVNKVFFVAILFCGSAVVLVYMPLASA